MIIDILVMDALFQDWKDGGDSKSRSVFPLDADYPALRWAVASALTWITDLQIKMRVDQLYSLISKRRIR
jgi:hypothetical protein